MFEKDVGRRKNLWLHLDSLEPAAIRFTLELEHLQKLTMIDFVQLFTHEVFYFIKKEAVEWFVTVIGFVPINTCILL